MVACATIAAALMPTRSVSEPRPWFVGEKVLCVNNRFLDLSDAPELVEGQAYTIKDILPARRGHLGLVVEEVRAKARYTAFDERRFAFVPTWAAGKASQGRNALGA